MYFKSHFSALRIAEVALYRHVVTIVTAWNVLFVGQCGLIDASGVGVRAVVVALVPGFAYGSDHFNALLLAAPALHSLRRSPAWGARVDYIGVENILLVDHIIGADAV